MTEDVKSLVEYRLQQAHETLTVARELFVGQHFRDAVNRAYYAMFYAALGILATKLLGSSKHSGVFSLFSQQFVKTGRFSIEAADYLRQAFELRQKSDYREFVHPDHDQVEELLAHAEVFIAEAVKAWNEIQTEDHKEREEI